MVQAPNDKQQIEPMLDKLDALPEVLGEAEILLADTGYFSAHNVAACNMAGIEPIIADFEAWQWAASRIIRLWQSGSRHCPP